MNDDPDKVSHDATPDPSATDHVEPATEQFEPVTEEFEPIGAEEGVEGGAEEGDEPETERPVVEDDAATAEPTRRRGVSGVLAANPMRVVLAAIVIGAIVAGGIAFALGSFTDNGNVGSTDIGENERLTQNAFTRSVVSRKRGTGRPALQRPAVLVTSFAPA